jgi:hypothetical protein
VPVLAHLPASAEHTYTMKVQQGIFLPQKRNPGSILG